VPLWLKLAYTAFMAVLVPVYLRNYGPTNFLYFCDVALIITLVGIWIESPLLVSMCAVGIIASQTLSVIDFLSNLIGHPLTGHRLYVHGRPFAVRSRPVAVSRLAALPGGLSGVAARLPRARAASLDRGCLVAGAYLPFPHAAAAGRSGPNPRGHWPRAGLPRPRGAAP